MDTIPQEVLNHILEELAQPVITEFQRLKRIPSSNCRAILNARLVCSGFYKAAQKPFMKVLHQTGFSWSRKSRHNLTMVSRDPHLVSKMTHLSFTRFPLESLALSDEYTQVRKLANIMRRFTNLKHVTYYQCSRKYLGSRLDYTDEFVKKYFRQGHSVATLFEALSLANIRLDTFETPLDGNRAWWTAIPNDHFIHTHNYLSSASEVRLSLHVPKDRPRPSLIFSGAKFSSSTLRVLEISVAGFIGPKLGGYEITLPTLKTDLPNLVEFRLSGTGKTCFSEVNLFDFCELHPKLQRLGLAHIQIFETVRSWNWLLNRLRKLDLQQLRLINPGVLSILPGPPRGPNATRVRYVPYVVQQEQFADVATCVQVVYADTKWEYQPWADDGSNYTGFSVFEDGEWDRGKYVELDGSTLYSRNRTSKMIEKIHSAARGDRSK